MKRSPHFLLGVIALLCLTACKVELYSGLEEREANKILAALGSVNIPASKTRGARDEGVTVFVDQSRFSDAMQVLTAKGLPEQHYDTMGEIFRKEGFVSSPTEERARMIYALSQELSRTIAEIDGVLSARIHVVLPETDMLGRDTKPSSASVFLRYSVGREMEQFTSQIKLLVANSIEGLVYDNITVVMIPSEQAQTSATNAETPQYVSFMGVWVHPASVERLRAIAFGLGVLFVILLGLVVRPFLLRHRAEPVFDDGL